MTESGGSQRRVTESGGSRPPVARDGPPRRGLRVAILTVSDRSARGEREDATGPAVEAALAPLSFEVVARCVVPDDADVIGSVLRRWCDEDAADLVVTNGGTGLGPRDLTPEATAAVLERLVPGIPETMRRRSPTPFAALSRQIAGVRGRTLVVNVPGSPAAARECLEAVLDILPHAVEMVRS